MPQTSRVPEVRFERAAAVSAGLREIADLLDAQPWVMDETIVPSAPQELLVLIEHADDVRVLAQLLGEEVTEKIHDGHVHTWMSVTYGMARLRVSSATAPLKPLRRDPQVTEQLAERDA